jgi:hypothetical protein
MEIYGVKPDGEIEGKFELNNSWLGAARVWTKLGDFYFGEWDYEKEFDKARREGREPPDPLAGPWQRTWDLQYSDKITDFEWTTLMSTMDGCIIPKEHFELVARHFREFHKKYEPSHYAKCAEAIEQLGKEGYIGYCVNATSVNQNPWWVYLTTEELNALPAGADDSGRPYNVNVDEKHWFYDPAQRAAAIKQGKPKKK